MTTQTAEQQRTLLVRIHPYNPARGHVKKTFIVQGFGTTFSVDSGWYEVREDVARDLAKFRNNPEDPTSPKIFQIVSKEQAGLIRNREVQKAAEPEAPIQATMSAIKSRNAIPKPVTIPAEEAEDAPAAKRTLAPTETNPDLDEVEDEDVILDFDEFDEADDAPVGRGDMTTADLIAPAPAPKAVAKKLPKKKA